MKKTKNMLVGVLASIAVIACNGEQRSLDLPKSPAAENTVASPRVEGRQVPDPMALPSAVAEQMQGPMQHEAPVSSFSVPGIMQVARCQNWLVATDAAGTLHRWHRNSVVDNFIARPNVHLPGLTTALSCAGEAEVLLSIGSMLLRIQLEGDQLAYQSLSAKSPRALAQLSDGRLAVLDVSAPVKVIVLDDAGQVQIVEVSSTTKAVAATDNGGFVALDAKSKSLDFYNASGELTRSFARAGTGSHDWDAPSFVQVYNNIIAVVDSRRSLVFTYDMQGQALGRFGENSLGQRELSLPSSLAFDGDSLWVASRMNGQLRRYAF